MAMDLSEEAASNKRTRSIRYCAIVSLKDESAQQFQFNKESVVCRKFRDRGRTWQVLSHLEVSNGDSFVKATFRPDLGR